MPTNDNDAIIQRMRGVAPEKGAPDARDPRNPNVPQSSELVFVPDDPLLQRLQWSGRDAMTTHLSLGMATLHADAFARIQSDAKQLSYLTQENSVLHERVRRLEIALAKETEACAKVAEDYGIARYHYEAEGKGGKQDAMTATKAIATLIRGREL